MGSLLLIVAVAAACAVWVYGNRRLRVRWLERLELPGSWVWEAHDGELELEGALDSGRYRLRDGDREERGEWRLQGHELQLRPAAGPPSALDLRLFTQGKIGLHGPGRERRIYVKRRGNVVPLRRQG